MKDLFLSWGMLVLSVMFNAFGVFVVKMKLNEFGAIKVDSLKAVLSAVVFLLKEPLVVIGVVLFFVAPFLFVIALSRMDIVIAYPAQIGLNFLCLVIFAVSFLGEQLTLARVVGSILILSGILLLQKFSL